MTKVRIKDEMYQREVYLVFDVSTDEANAFLEKTGNVGCWDDETGGSHSSVYGSNTHYILIRKRGVDSWSLGTLAHEVLHLTFSVLYSAGLKYGTDSEEAFTYYFQKMFTQCVDVFKKRKPKQTK